MQRGLIRFFFLQGDFEMFSLVWYSIESLCLTIGLRKNYAREKGVRSFKSVRIFSAGAYLGDVKLKEIDHYAEIPHY